MGKMKLLLVNPYFKGGVMIPSLGLGFIGTYVRDHSDCEVEIIEPALQNMTEMEILDKVKESDIIGITCYTESRFQVLDFAEKAKHVNPSCKTVVGGPHVNTLDELILKYYSFVDVVVRKEGEESILDIINNKPFNEIFGITWRDKDGKIIKNPDRILKKNIDDFHYDYSMVFHQIDKWKDLEIPYELQKLNAIPIIASRGCPYQCAFCAAHKQWDKIYRTLSSEELVKRMEYLVNRYNIRYFRFYDTVFMSSEKKTLEFCSLLKKSKIKVSFRIDIKVGTSRNALEKLREVGCDVVGFGVESGSDKVLKRMNKGITRAQIEETIKICKELGYWMIGYFMVSIPTETKEDIKKTFELLKFFDEINVQFFKIHPNTPFYNELKQKGEINDEIWFDPDYGNEIPWCEEVFRGAILHRDEAYSLVHYASSKHIIKQIVRNPQNAIQRYGFIKSIKSMLILPLFMIMNILLGNKIGRNFFWKLTNAEITKNIYRWLI